MITTRHAPRALLFVVGMILPMSVACGSAVSTGRFEGFWQTGTLALAPPGQGVAQAPAWTIQPGDGVVLVMYRSEGTSHQTADNEELVVQLAAAELGSGKPVALEAPGRVVRYQHGGQKLDYASTTVKGAIAAQRDGDRVRGQVTLTASVPSVNATGRGEVARQFSFELDRK